MEALAQLNEERGGDFHYLHQGSEQVEAGHQDQWRSNPICEEPATVGSLPRLHAIFWIPYQTCDEGSCQEAQTDRDGVQHNMGMAER